MKVVTQNQQPRYLRQTNGVLESASVAQDLDVDGMATSLSCRTFRSAGAICHRRIIRIMITKKNKP
jgi:hypothetical protein